MAERSIVVVGAGIVGASLAYHLAAVLDPTEQDQLGEEFNGGMPPLIGRAAELDQLAAAAGLDATTDARSGLVVLSGDAGIGKTRLLTELTELAVRQGRRAVVGQCVDLADSPLPYLPFLEIFDRLIDGSDADRIAAAHPALAPLLAGRRGGAQEDRGQPDRGALIESTWSVLNEAAQAQPLLVIIEDAHWADQSSLELIGYLLARPCPAPVSIVVSYRSDDLHRDHPLRPVLAGWIRRRGVVRLDLDRLPEESVRDLVRSLDDHGLTEEQVRRLIDRAGGNAFFIEELVAAGAGPDGLPGDLAELLLLRLERLDPAGQKVVRSASAAGHPIPYDLLRQVTELPTNDLDLALRAATQHQLLVADAEDRFAFRHALLAEAVYRDLLPGERTRLHRAYLTALSATAGAEDAELARHALAAGDHERALPASIRAAEAAEASAGPAEALRHYEVALRLAAEPGSDANPADLAVRASACALSAGQLDRASSVVREALLNDVAPPARARLLHALAAVGLQTDQPIDAVAAADEALTLLPPEPSPFRTRVLATRVLALSAAFRDDESIALADEVAEQAKRFELPDALTAVRTAQAWITSLHGDPEQVRALLWEAVAAARAHNDPAELRALYNLGGLALEEGNLIEARSNYLDCYHRAIELGHRYSPFALEARTHAGIVAYQLGDWDAVLALTDTMDEAPPELAAAAMAAVRMIVAAGRGEDTERCWTAAREAWASDGHLIMLTGTARIDEYGAAGDLGAAERMHDETVAAAAKVWGFPDFQGRIRLAALLIGQYANGIRRVAPADLPPIMSRLTELAAGAAEARGMGRHIDLLGPEGRAWLARLNAELLRLRWLAGIDPPSTADLIAPWDETLAGFERFPHVYEHARTEARLAGVLRATGDPARAELLAESARAVAQRLGARPLLAELDAAVPTRESDHVLTPREHQVLALVAEGRSNSEVARALVITTKTASVHVSNILAKPGAASRTEAVTVARRQGLLD